MCEKHREAYEESGGAVLRDETMAEGGVLPDVQPIRVREAQTQLVFFHSQL